MEYKNKLDKDYINLITHVLNNGSVSGDRTGTGTIKTFVNVIRHNMKDGFPLLTTKQVWFKGVATEFLWMLSGDTNIRYMLENGVYIWVGDAYKKYNNSIATNPMLEPMSEQDFIDKIISDKDFGDIWGELGPVYGSQWRNWNGEGIDQLKNVIHDLKNNPNSRRHIVTAWNPGKLKDMTLPPCHNFFQFFVEETVNDNSNIKYRLSLNFNMRSVDVGLGLPFDIASYALLLLLIAQEVGMEAHELTCTLNDTHIYLDQVEKIKEIYERESHILPTFELTENKSIFDFTYADFKLINYKHSGKLNLPLSN